MQNSEINIGLTKKNFYTSINDQGVEMELGYKIKTMRKSCGMTQEDFGAQIGVTKGTVSAWEKNLRTPSIKAYQKIIEVYKEKIKLNYSNSFIFNINDKTPQQGSDNEKNNTELTDCTSLSSLGFNYVGLDSYGKETVKSVIDSEFQRCLNTKSLLNIDYISVNIFFTYENQVVKPSESNYISEYLKKIAKLDKWGKLIVEHTIKTCQARCECEGFNSNYSNLVINIAPSQTTQ